jgi:hypothetical protein
MVSIENFGGLKMKILSVTIRQAYDDCSDIDDLGVYSDECGPGAINREEMGDYCRGQFRYFTPTMTGEETGNPESPLQDYKRAEDYNSGLWWKVGRWATAKIQLTENGPIQKIESGGLWGIESDCGDYVDEVDQEELSTLRDELKAIGFSDCDLDAAFTTISYNLD